MFLRIVSTWCQAWGSTIEAQGGGRDVRRKRGVARMVGMQGRCSICGEGRLSFLIRSRDYDMFLIMFSALRYLFERCVCASKDAGYEEKGAGTGKANL